MFIKNTKITSFIFFLYLALIFFLYIFFINNYCIKNFNTNYSISDILINYEGGFIRRGLLGTIFLEISQYFEISIVFLIKYFFLFFYFLFFIFYFFLIKELIIKNIILFFFISISSLGILYPLYELESLLRKEIFLYFSFIVFIFLLEKKVKNIYFYIYLNFSFVSLVLIHEGLFFFLFTFFLLWNFKKNIDGKSLKFKEFIFSSIGLMIILIFHLYYFAKGNSHDQISLIIESLSAYNYKPVNAIFWLKRDLLDAISINYQNINIAYLTRYLFIFIVSFVPIFFFLNKANILNKKNIVFLSLCFLSYFILFIIALDWGRFISIIFNLFLFCLAFLYRSKSIRINFNNINQKIIIFIIVLFSISWNPKTTFMEEINLLPVKDVFEYYSNFRNIR